MSVALNKRIVTWISLLAIMSFLCGCAGISERTQSYLGSPQLEPVNPASVQILPMEPQSPKTMLGEIVLSVRGNPSRRKLDNKFKNAAARLGADGVFIASDQTRITPVEYLDCWGPDFSDVWQRIIVGVAFKYK